MNVRPAVSRCPTASLLPMLLVGVAHVALAGCGDSIGDVSGTITYKKKAVAIGHIVFLAGDQRTYQGTITDGAYRVAVPAGEARVAILSPDPALAKKRPPPKDPKANANPRPAPWPPELMKKWFPIPQHVDKHISSGLAFTVRIGKNTYNIEIADEPPKEK